MQRTRSRGSRTRRARAIGQMTDSQSPLDRGDCGVVPTLIGRTTGGMMERLRIGVIGLGWFGEIHCETIVGVPNLELAALCTRTPERLSALAAKFGVQKTYRDYRDLLADPEIDAVSIVTMWD